MYAAAVEAISATDKAVGTVYAAAQDAGYVLAITADHGNAEQMLNAETGQPHTAHTTNKVSHTYRVSVEYSAALGIRVQRTTWHSSTAQHLAFGADGL